MWSNGLRLACILVLFAAADTKADQSLPLVAELKHQVPEFCKNLPRKAYSNLERIPYKSDWFELYQLTPEIIAIYEPHNWQEVISYLIIGKTKALLFDTGNGIDNILKVVSSLTDKPIEVLNSHSHYDHVGGNYLFEKIYGMNTSFTQTREQGRTPAEIGIEVSKQALCIPAPNGLKPENHVGTPFQVTHFISHGDKIDLGGILLEIIHIPGHTPDSIAMLDRERGLLWTGDSFYAGPIWLNGQETDLHDYRKSLDKLLAQLPGVKALLPAHNTPWVEPELLKTVSIAFDDMLKGKLLAKKQDDGLVEYFYRNNPRFSFLMRDEPLPYKIPEVKTR